jgi:RNA polymerase sigma-70 factor (ECF subfamily)
VLVADGGGFAPAVRRPVQGATKVAAILSGLGRLVPGFSATALQVNGAPALVIDVPGDGPTVITATVEDGRITRLYAMRNPQKLGRLAEETPLSR